MTLLGIDKVLHLYEYKERRRHIHVCTGLFSGQAVHDIAGREGRYCQYQHLFFESETKAGRLYF